MNDNSLNVFFGETELFQDVCILGFLPKSLKLNGILSRTLWNFPKYFSLTTLVFFW